MEPLGELIVGLLGYAVLRLITGGRWQSRGSTFVECLVGAMCLFLLLMFIGGGVLLASIWMRQP